MTPSSLRNPFDFSGKVVLVTASAKGIGRGIALRFAEAGARVGVHYRSSAADGGETVEMIKALGGQAALFQADVTQPGEVKEFFSAVRNTFRRLDILINNAGSYPTKPLLDLSAEEWDSVLKDNLRSVHLCTQSAARLMSEEGHGGSIINIASIEGLSTAPGHSHYAAAKAGVLMHTRSAAVELARYGIRVNAVSPGLIHRPGIEEQAPDFVAHWKQTNPSGRLGLPEEIGDACLFLASPAAAWITGVNLPVDGGALAL